jgi:hypothetical protein
MDRFIFARPRPSPWRRGMRSAAAIAGVIALVGTAAGAGLLLSIRLNQITAHRTVSDAPPTSSLLRHAHAATPGERRFLAAEIARDACKQAVLARVAHPAQASRSGFYQAAVSFMQRDGANVLQVTGKAQLTEGGADVAPHLFSCEVRDGRVVKLALVPAQAGHGRRPG